MELRTFSINSHNQIPRLGVKNLIWPKNIIPENRQIKMIALLSDILLKALFTPETPINEDHKPKYIQLLGYAASVYEVFEEVKLSYSSLFGGNFFMDGFSLPSKKNKGQKIIKDKWILELYPSLIAPKRFTFGIDA